MISYEQKQKYLVRTQGPEIRVGNRKCSIYGRIGLKIYCLTTVKIYTVHVIIYSHRDKQSKRICQ